VAILQAKKLFSIAAPYGLLMNQCLPYSFFDIANMTNSSTSLEQLIYYCTIMA